MLELILFRALQGIGGGGLMIGAQAVIADVVPPRERGRYSGLFGAIFGAATVLGPLAGGFIVEYWNWRGIFFVNVPFGIAALIVTAAVLPGVSERVQHVIDYAGVITLTIAASALVLFTSLGGSSFAWGSWQSLTLLVAGVVFTVLFIAIERKSAEPVLSPSLFKNRVFSSASAIGFVVGFAMFGALTFLPLFFQDVRGMSPTASGLRLLPMMVGLFCMSIMVGQLVSKGRKYRPFPILGTGIMTVGIALIATVTTHTSMLLMGVYMFIMGAGLGLVMQVLITAVQNAVPVSEVGAATAGANFFRSIGGSFGTAVFGAIYTNLLPHELVTNFVADKVTSPLSAKALSSLTPATVHQLPTNELVAILDAIAKSIQHIYIFAVPVGLVAFVLSLTLPEIKLRSTIHHVSEEIPMSTGTSFE
jgi:EmrB/QacA subfamily drug resistance transporter